MTENYTIHKTIPSFDIEINITVNDRDLFIKFDNMIFEVIKEHYHLDI